MLDRICENFLLAFTALIEAVAGPTDGHPSVETGLCPVSSLLLPNSENKSVGAVVAIHAPCQWCLSRDSIVKREEM